MVRVPGCETVYEVANQWRERCIVDEKSLLWPEETTWTEAHLQHSIELLGHTGPSSADYWGFLGQILDGEHPAVSRLISDLTVIYHLAPVWVRPETKRQAVRQVLVAAGDPQPPLLNVVDSAFDEAVMTVATPYLSKDVGLEYFADVVLRAKRGDPPSNDRDNLESHADASLSERKGGAIQARNILMHLCFPDDYEAISSRSAKIQIVSSLGQGLPVNSSTDAALQIIRTRLEQELGRPGFSFYEEDIQQMWKESNASEVSSDSRITLDGTKVIEVERQKAPYLRYLHKKTYLDAIDLVEIESLLLDKKQIIFEGPPGSGKTFLADLFARYFTENPLEGEHDERIEVVQFHQSYGYEDFVQGIRPVTDGEGRLQYRVMPGIFLQHCERARANPDKRFVLIIDEINRGNLSRIFGELLMLLEYRDKKVRLPYAAGDGVAEQSHLQIPPNLYLIGTMNSTDRSLAMIDYALRRRFFFYRLLPVVNGQATVLERWLAGQDFTTAQQTHVLDVLRPDQPGDRQAPLGRFPDRPLLLHGCRHRRAGGARSRLAEGAATLLEEYFHTARGADEIIEALAPRPPLPRACTGRKIDDPDHLDDGVE